jgi:hypothetical protein
MFRNYSTCDTKPCANRRALVVAVGLRRDAREQLQPALESVIHHPRSRYRLHRIATRETMRPSGRPA